MKRKMSPEEEKAFRAKFERRSKHMASVVAVLVGGHALMLLTGVWKEEYEKAYWAVSLIVIASASLLTVVLPDKNPK